VLEAADKSANLGYFLRAPPSIGTKEDDQNNQADGEGLKTMREGADGVPGSQGENDGKNQEQNKSEAPKFILALFELLQA